MKSSAAECHIIEKSSNKQASAVAEKDDAHKPENQQERNAD